VGGGAARKMRPANISLLSPLKIVFACRDDLDERHLAGHSRADGRAGVADIGFLNIYKRRNFNEIQAGVPLAAKTGNGHARLTAACANFAIIGRCDASSSCCAGSNYRSL